MESFADLIPLLLIAGSVILSLFTGKNKKKPKNNRPPVFHPLPDTFQDDETIETLFETLETAPETIESIDEEPRIAPRASTTTFKSKLKKQSIAPTQSLPVEEEAVPLIDIQDLDEIKKAVIYSEILNRKEF